MPNADKQQAEFARAVTRLIGLARKYDRDKSRENTVALSRAERELLDAFYRASSEGSREAKTLRDTIAERETLARRVRASLCLKCSELHHNPREYHRPGADCPAVARVSDAIDTLCGGAPKL